MVYSKVEGIKKTSFQLRHLIKDNGNEIIAEAMDVIVFYDFNKNSKEIIHADLMERLINPC
jgi:acyl-CoA thioester hydrolase